MGQNYSIVQSTPLESGSVARLVNKFAFVGPTFLIPQTMEDEIRNGNKTLVRNAEGNRNLGKGKDRCQGYTEVNLKYIGCEIVNRAHVTQNTGYEVRENFE